MSVVDSSRVSSLVARFSLFGSFAFCYLLCVVFNVCVVFVC